MTSKIAKKIFIRKCDMDDASAINSIAEQKTFLSKNGKKYLKWTLTVFNNHFWKTCYNNL